MDIPAILLSIRPGAQWTLTGDSYDGLIWIGPGVKPTQKELEDAWPSVQAQRATKASALSTLKSDLRSVADTSDLGTATEVKAAVHKLFKLLKQKNIFD